MAGQTVNLTDLASANGQYTFSFVSDGSWKLSPADAIARIRDAQLPIADMAAEYTGGVFGTGTFGNQLDVAFTWTQSGWTIQQLIQNMEGALDNGVMGHYTFINGVGGYASSGLMGQIKQLLGQSAGNSKTSIWGWVLLVVVILGILAGVTFTYKASTTAAERIAG